MNERLDKSHTGIKIAGRNINNLRYADNTTLMAKSEEELKIILMRVKEESEKAGLNLNSLKKQTNKQNKNHKTKIMESGSISSQQIEGGKVEAVTDFIFLGSKITVHGD